MGSPGVSSGYFPRTIVGYTGVNPVTDRGLRLVLQTRPGFPPPQIRLPSTFGVRGIPVRRPARLPPASFRHPLLKYPCLRLPFASVRLGLDFARQPCQTAGHHHLAAGPRPGTQQPNAPDKPVIFVLCFETGRIISNEIDFGFSRQTKYVGLDNFKKKCLIISGWLTMW